LTNPASVKARLKNLAIKNGKLFQEELTAYCIERTIYRISNSRYKENFTLKGGIFLYALFNGNYTRATKDIDFLAKSLNNDIEKIKSIFEEIFKIRVDDAVYYDIDTLKIEQIIEFKEYSGINLSIFAYLDRTKVLISIDIGFSDIVYPDRVLMDYPVILDMEIPQIYAYSLETVIAEKFEAIVSLGYLNSRYKDFYDIYILLKDFDFVGEDLFRAIEETFYNRGTKFEDIVAFDKDFIEDEIRILRWNSFIEKKRAVIKTEFPEVMKLIKLFLKPIVDRINNNEKFNKVWISDRSKWIDNKKQGKGD
jgi:predicted nucleotidyltransferase component of viral defense system